MNLEYLIELQGGLMEHIKKEKGIEKIPADETELAFKVELGECANEWRGFKYWSKDREPRLIKRIDCSKCAGTGLGKRFLKNCEACNGSGTKKVNPLLEEYVDGLSFAMQILILFAQEQDFNVLILLPDIDSVLDEMKESTVTNQFNYLYYVSSTLFGDYEFHKFMAAYINLGEMLGFTTSEIETAYIEKNKINHERQNSGY
jgi:dimeric dUTPase (all-alpha-NTP-PPase superfamily)